MLEVECRVVQLTRPFTSTAAKRLTSCHATHSSSTATSEQLQCSFTVGYTTPPQVPVGTRCGFSLFAPKCCYSSFSAFQWELGAVLVRWPLNALTTVLIHSSGNSARLSLLSELFKNPFQCDLSAFACCNASYKLLALFESNFSAVKD